MNKIDHDPDKFDVDPYGNLIPKETENETNGKDRDQEQS
jgi:hypothetical protein